MTDQRTRNCHTILLDDKKASIKASKTELKTVDLVKHFDNKYPYFTIDTILKNKEEILNVIDEGAHKKWANLKVFALEAEGNIARVVKIC
jgi:hypothetical protein